MSMCSVFSCVVVRGCLLWPVRSLGRSLLAFALLHSVLQGQTCLLLQVFLACLLVFKLRAPGPTNIFFLSWILFYWISKFVLLKGIEPISIYLYSKEYCILEILPYLDVPAHFLLALLSLRCSTQELCYHMRDLYSCSMWDLVPWPGIIPGAPGLGMQSQALKQRWSPANRCWRPMWCCVLLGRESFQSQGTAFMMCWEGCEEPLASAGGLRRHSQWKPFVLGILSVSSLLSADGQTMVFLGGMKRQLWQELTNSKTSLSPPVCTRITSLLSMKCALWAFCRLVLMCVWCGGQFL